MSARLRVGARRFFVTLEAPVDLADDNGGAIRSYAGIATFWASIVPKSAAMIFRAGQQAQSITHEISFRARPGMTAAMRLRLGDRVFQILGMSALDEKGAVTRAQCEEIKP